MTKTYRTELYTYHTYSKLLCVICGESYEQNYVSVYLLGGEHPNRILGNVCSFCLSRGAEQSVRTVKKRIEHLKEIEQALKGVDIDTWVSPEQVLKVQEQVNSAIVSSIFSAMEGETFEPY